MKIYNLNNMEKGWFIGNFEPSIYKTDIFEISVKEYKANNKEKPHYHKLSDEYTIILCGKVKINGIEYNENDIILIEKNEIAEFESITDSKTLVVKIPSSLGDKYMV